MEPILDKCPGYNLYIGGFIGLRRPKALKNCHITHIVSVLDWQFEEDSPLIRGYQHLHIPVDDVEDENLLDWFPRSNAFIEQGLNYWKTKEVGSNDSQESADEGRSGVYIHCAMGKSRSATILLAYLLWSSRQPRNQGAVPGDSPDMISLQPKPLSVIEALQLLRGGRPIAEPNEGFMHQLHMYEDMGCPTSESKLKAHKIYRRWMNKRNVEESLRVNQAPDMFDIRFEDEDEADSDTDVEEGQKTTPAGGGNERNDAQHTQEVAPGIRAPDGTQSIKPSHKPSPSEPQVTLKCRKCRHPLATTPFILEHSPPPHRDPNYQVNYNPADKSPLPPPQCAHIFLHPLSWMKEVLSEGKIEGRLSCPNRKCGVNIGKFAWTGLRCSCGGWVTPGFGIIRGKVDEITTRPSAAGRTVGPAEGGLPGGAAVRLPPGMRRGNL